MLRVSLIALAALALLPVTAGAHSSHLCAERDRCTSDAQCNDKDPCTKDTCELLPEGGCCDHDPVASCLDAFLCYDVATHKGSAAFDPVHGVAITDPFEDLRADLTSVHALCAPADRDGQGIHNPQTHLDRYRIVPAAGSAARATPRNVKVETALGEVSVDAVAGDELLVPAAKDRTRPPPAPERPGVNGFKCYGVKLSPKSAKVPKNLRVNLADQFAAAPRTYAVGAPVYLCSAANVDGAGLVDTCQALLCYGVKSNGQQSRFTRVNGLWVHDRFGLHQLDAVQDYEACVPAVVNDHACLERGFGCSENADCSGGHCVDGVCCESACDTPCYACSGKLTGEPHGTCAPISKPGAVDTGCGGSTGCAGGSCACDGLGHCKAAP